LTAIPSEIALSSSTTRILFFAIPSLSITEAEFILPLAPAGKPQQNVNVSPKLIIVSERE
jgi:hypothetical protein